MGHAIRLDGKIIRPRFPLEVGDFAPQLKAENVAYLLFLLNQGIGDELYLTGKTDVSDDCITTELSLRPSPNAAVSVDQQNSEDYWSDWRWFRWDAIEAESSRRHVSDEEQAASERRPNRAYCGEIDAINPRTPEEFAWIFYDGYPERFSWLGLDKANITTRKKFMHCLACCLECHRLYLRCCPVCGRFFVATHRSTKYCSTQARQKARPKVKRDRAAYMREHRQIPSVKRRVTTRKRAPAR